MEPTATPETETELVDIAHLRDLLSMLRDLDVAQFSAGGIQVVFHEKPEPIFTPAAAKKMVEDDGHSTSNRRVEGFANGSFRDPALWASQGGKVLQFDGTYK